MEHCWFTDRHTIKNFRKLGNTKWTNNAVRRLILLIHYIHSHFSHHSHEVHSLSLSHAHTIDIHIYPDQRHLLYIFALIYGTVNYAHKYTFTLSLFAYCKTIEFFGVYDHIRARNITKLHWIHILNELVTAWFGCVVWWMLVKLFFMNAFSSLLVSNVFCC